MVDCCLFQDFTKIRAKHFEKSCRHVKQICVILLAEIMYLMNNGRVGLPYVLCFRHLITQPWAYPELEEGLYRIHFGYILSRME